MKLGDSVAVKPETVDPDFGIGIGGWQGRVIQIDEDLVLIEWDSVTLNQLDFSIVERSIEEKLNWKCMWLYTHDVERAAPRDDPQDVAAAQHRLHLQVIWLWLGEQGQRITEVLEGVDENDVIATFSAWKRYLERRLTFPFEADVIEHWMRVPVTVGDRVEVQGFAGIRDPYGILVRVKLKGRTYSVPLCDLEATDEESTNRQPIEDYSLWFANR